MFMLASLMSAAAFPEQQVLRTHPGPDCCGKGATGSCYLVSATETEAYTDSGLS